jgi:cytochrome c oxidase subunit III
MTRTTTVVGDIADLKDYAFGPTSLGWWAVFGFMLVEGMGFVLAIGAYFFLLAFEAQWPPTGGMPPLGFSTVGMVLAVLTVLPNLWVDRMAHGERRAQVRVGLVLMSILGLILVVLRGFEMNALSTHVRWDQNAYGSIVWALIVLHFTHTITDLYDTFVLAALAYRREMTGRRLSDVSDNALYWHFIVASWFLIYVVVYWTPRWV